MQTVSALPVQKKINVQDMMIGVSSLQLFLRGSYHTLMLFVLCQATNASLVVRIAPFIIHDKARLCIKVLSGQNRDFKGENVHQQFACAIGGIRRPGLTEDKNGTKIGAVKARTWASHLAG